MSPRFVLTAFMILAAPSVVYAQNLFYLDGSSLPPDTDPSYSPGPPGTWDWYNTNPYPQTFGFPPNPPVAPYNTSQTPLGPGSGPPLDPSRGPHNDDRIITGTSEPASRLANNNSGIFMTKNARDGGPSQTINGTTYSFDGIKNQYEYTFGTDAVATLTSRFKIDWTNNQTGVNNGDALLSLQVGQGAGIALTVHDEGYHSGNPDHYSLELIQYGGLPAGSNFVSLATPQLIDPRPGQSFAQSSPGYFTTQLIVDSTNHSAELRLWDEFTGKIFDQTFSNLPYSSNTINGNVEFGAGTTEVTNGGAELKAIFDYVRLDSGTLAPAYAPGDVNFDGVVNGLDIAQVASHWLQSGPVLGDANGDGVVNGLDIALIASHWLQASPPFPPPSFGGGSGAAVPEPSSSLLAFVGIACLAWIRVRRSRARSVVCH